MPASFNPMDPTSWPAFAPYYLTQDILRGWSFITVNENNSSAPDTERRVTARDSYGRQLGKLMDAVEVLIARSGGDDPAFADLAALKARIDEAKAEAKADRLARLARDLADLKTANPDAFKALIASVG